MRKTSGLMLKLPLPMSGRLWFGDLGEEDVLRFLHRYSGYGVSHAEVADIEQRQDAASDKDDVSRQAHPLDEGVGRVCYVFEGAGLVVAVADGLVELEDAQGEERGEAHPGQPYIQGPEADLGCAVGPALLRNEVMQAEDREPSREHPVDAHHCRVAVVGCEGGANLVVRDDGQVYEKPEDPGAQEIPETDCDQKHHRPAVWERGARPRLLPRPELQKAPRLDRKERERYDLGGGEERAQSHMLGGSAREVEVVHRPDHASRGVE